MADEPELLPGTEAPTTEPAEAIEIETEETVELEGDGEPQPDPDEEEFDWEGRKVKGPKGLKDGVLRQADYTKKTQEIAETRRELEARKQRIDQQSKASEEELQSRAALHHIESELKRFPEGYDWSAYQQHRQNDPIAADEAWQYYQHLRQQKSEAGTRIQQAEQTRTTEAQQEIAKRLQETADYARTKIKGWTPDTDKQVIDFARSKGATDADLQRLMSPMVYEMIHLARIGEQALQKATTTPRPAPQAQTPPLTTVGARTNPPARKTLSEMSMTEHAAYFAKQKAAGVVK